ncbi:hybrid sensor histidine kinase/response regulator [Desulfospira joergensenii]|uniref:hybrid sensor histidine kinase/response regulator n=1 Tax=Desulfospira joergensenii TaxID=53329 RepID=UPI0003B3EE37|nr:ATP-binding protein [Desulfospira joergensenii]
MERINPDRATARPIDRRMDEQEVTGLAGEITNAAPVGICFTRQHVICFANTTFLKMTGYTGQELKHQSLGIFHPEGASIERPEKESAAKTGEGGFFRSQDCWVRKDGSILYCSVRCRPLDDRPGDQVWVIADVSERIRLENERKDLEHQLVKAQKLEALGILAGGIAHDFNNILSPIMGYAQLLLMDAKDETQKKYISGIFKAAVRSRDLIGQILSFCRRREEEPRPIRIQPIAKEITKLLSETLPATIRVRIEIDSTCGPVLANPSQIYQVIMNLCTNAYQSMAEEGGTLGIRIRRQVLRHLKFAEQGPFVVLQVSDTGPGITKGELDHIFEPYYTTKTHGRGTGLGLSVVHGIVRRTGGFIRVNTNSGLGAEFSVFLPEIQKKEGQREGEPAVLPVEGQSSGHILLVDDEIEVAAITEALLVRLGYKVTMITSSSAALEIFKRSPLVFDLVITDQTMPDLTGTQLAASIKGVRPDIPVILHTGYPETLTNPEHIDATLLKPADMGELGRITQAVTTAKQAQT